MCTCFVKPVTYIFFVCVYETEKMISSCIDVMEVFTYMYKVPIYVIKEERQKIRKGNSNAVIENKLTKLGLKKQLK